MRLCEKCGIKTDEKHCSICGLKTVQFSSESDCTNNIKTEMVEDEKKDNKVKRTLFIILFGLLFSTLFYFADMIPEHVTKDLFNYLDTNRLNTQKKLGGAFGNAFLFSLFFLFPLSYESMKHSIASDPYELKRIKMNIIKLLIYCVFSFFAIFFVQLV